MTVRQSQQARCQQEDDGKQRWDAHRDRGFGQRRGLSVRLVATHNDRQQRGCDKRVRTLFDYDVLFVFLQKYGSFCSPLGGVFSQSPPPLNRSFPGLHTHCQHTPSLDTHGHQFAQDGFPSCSQECAQYDTASASGNRALHAVALNVPLSLLHTARVALGASCQSYAYTWLWCVCVGGVLIAGYTDAHVQTIYQQPFEGPKQQHCTLSHTHIRTTKPYTSTITPIHNCTQPIPIHTLLGVCEYPFD